MDTSEPSTQAEKEQSFNPEAGEPDFTIATSPEINLAFRGKSEGKRFSEGRFPRSDFNERDAS
jgi:hypothetical protein